MLTYNITNWVETWKKLKWREALRLATQSPDRWTRRAAEWNPGPVMSRITQRRFAAAKKVCEWENKERLFMKRVVDDRRTQHCTTPRPQITYRSLHQRRYPTTATSPEAARKWLTAKTKSSQPSSRTQHESEDIQGIRGSIRFTASGTTTSIIHSFLATTPSGSLALSQRARLRLNLSHFFSL